MKYRRDIDGLRAVAVIPVILYHAGFPGFGGGFIGVDVFFVISGYLITRILVSEIEQGRFSILQFYERRARRILPALFLVIAFTAPLGMVFLLPDPLENLGQSIFATTLFSNNILLFLTSNYWDSFIEFKPLVHTWSLAIEEQFYLIYPALLLLLYRFRGVNIFISLSVLFVASLVLSQWGSANAPHANFYLLPFRMWELLAGALCVFLGKRTIEHQHGSMLALFGLALILFSVLAYDNTTPFPSAYALAPIIGASLIMLYGQRDGIANRVLAHKFFVGIGLISYSAYLWHQPLFAYLRVASKQEPGLFQYGLLIVLTLALAYFTWRYVETPFRNKDVINRKNLIVLASVFGVLLSTVGFVFHWQQGFPSRVFGKVAGNETSNYISYNERVFAYKKDNFTSNAKTRILVIGNSAARDFVNMIAENLPMEALEIIYRDESFECLDTGSVPVASHLVTQSDVVIFAIWDVRRDCEKEREFLTGSGKRVFYVGPKRFGYNLNWLARIPANDRMLVSNYLTDRTILDNERIRSEIPEESYMDILGKISNIAGTVFITDEQGNLLSMDRTHLTRSGARFVGQRVLNNAGFLNALQLPDDLLQ